MYTGCLRAHSLRCFFRHCLMIVVIAHAWAHAARAETIEFSAPLNGWRNSAGSEERYTQEVRYPAVTVNTPEGQSVNAKIAGRIKTTSKAASQARGGASIATLVVNGIPMPQRVEADGAFSRPFLFDAGSNSIELRTANGTRKSLQFYEAYSGKKTARLRVILAWDSDGTDLDLHVIAPDGSHTYYGDRVTSDGGALDVDVTSGFGPEIYSHASPQPGTYLVYLNYYGGRGDGSSITVAQITLITDANTIHEKRETVVVPMRQAGELILAKQFVMP